MERSEQRKGQGLRPLEFEVRQIDAWAEPDGGWTWNASYHLFDFVTSAKNVKRAFMKALARHGITFRRGKIQVEYTGDTYELCTKKDMEPIFAAIPKNF